jgi:PHP family Zn ribbon phosphoesterase
MQTHTKNTLQQSDQTLRIYKSDLHIHTCLSPCADLFMTPKRIIEKAQERGLDIIAICDHNSSENVNYVFEAAIKSGITIIAGMEITTSEEVHILGLFSDYQHLMKIQTKIYDGLEGKNNEDLFGIQAIVNQYDEVMGFNNKLLIGASSMTLKQVVACIHRNGGIAISSHIDRESFGILGKLGFIPDKLPLDAIEFSPQVDNIKAMFERNPELENYPLLYSSDAHRLEEIGSSYTAMLLANPTFQEIKLALKEKCNRQLRCHGVH